MKYPWMPLFNGDLLANTLHLSAQEFGAYMLLIIHAWEFNAKIKVADAQCIARVSNRHWTKVRETLAPFFDPPDGLRGNTTEVIHWRVAKELANAAELSYKRKAAALQMHEKRRANASVLHELCMPFASPQSQSPKESSVRDEGAPKVPIGNGTLPNFRDKGPDYRAPPARKSDNVLKPLVDKQLSRHRSKKA